MRKNKKRMKERLKIGIKELKCIGMVNKPTIEKNTLFLNSTIQIEPAKSLRGKPTEKVAFLN
jgi:hypothetical protein